ncbi:MAG: hypothetical protein QOH90_1801 [Actinomycetota bacterium]|jgi:hypothetical protein|nr:hypothetical protein [Actinomycetota bacterium]
MEEEEFDENAPLGESEREALQQDLVDVETLKSLLGPRGIRGAVFYCPDCQEDHFLAWDLLSGNLQELLEAGESPIHEPAFDPDPDDYVSWDYARGFLDGYESVDDEEFGAVADRLVLELRDRGWRANDVMSLFSRIGMRLPLPDDVEDQEAAP